MRYHYTPFDACLGQNRPVNQECYQFGTVRLNVGTQEVTVNDQLISLPPLSFSLLLTLARHAPNVVTTAQLEQEVWKGLVIDRGTINKRVVLVRNALRKAGCEQDYISVVRGTGYRLAIPVIALHETPEEQPEPEADLAAEPAPESALNPGSAMSTRLAWLMAALLILVLAYIVVSQRQILNEHSHQATPLVQERALPADPGNTASVAILPFKNVSADSEDTFFAEGVSLEISRLLRAYNALDVASSASAARAEVGAQPADVAGQLGVEYLVTGSVFRDEQHIMLMVQLLDVTNGTELWSRKFDEPLNELFNIQDQLAQEIAGTLSGKDPQRISGATATATTNIDAFTAYLAGRSRLDQRISDGQVAIEEGLAYFQQAIEIDPGFDRAHIGMAAAYFVSPSYAENADRSLLLQQAEASARYALQLSPDSSEALGVLAAIVASKGEPLQAAAFFEQSLALGNRDPNVLHWHAMLFTSMGYFERMSPVLAEAYRLDPLNQLLGCSLAGTLNFSGRPEESLQVLGNMSRFDRRDLAFGVASIYLRDFDQAREVLRGIKLREGPLPAHYADLFVDAFERPLQFDSVTAEILEDARSGALAELVAFELLLIMGSPSAFDLEVDMRDTYFEHRLPEGVWNNWGVALRQDPRFKNWIRTLGFDQYWRTNGWPDRCRPTGTDDFECI